MKATEYLTKDEKGSSNLAIKIAVRSLHILKADACGIWLKDDEAGLVPRFCYGIRTPFANYLFSKKNHNIAACVLKRNVPFSVYDLDKYSEDEEFKAYVKEEGLKSLLASSISVNGIKFGVIAVCTKGKYRRFTQLEKMLLSTLADEIASDIRNAELTAKIEDDYLNTIKTIAHILEANDEYTFGHSNKVMVHSVNVARMMHLGENEIELIRNAALLHDIGKVGIDQSIVRKEASLTDSEWQQIRKHPAIGGEIVRQAESLAPLAPLIEHHHERFGGGGYPNPELKDGKIPLGAKIISIADAFDAMTSARPYRKEPLTINMALIEIRKKAGDMFDPEISRIFIRYVKTKL